MKRPAFFSLFYLLLTLLPACLFAQQFSWYEQQSPAKASLRGLYVLNDSVAWATGASGTILRTMDGGIHWQQLPQPDTLDFRSIWAFSPHEAMVASAGQPAKVYYTRNGGEDWKLVFSDTSGLAFFDALQFRANGTGWLLSDPIRGESFLLETKNRGESWQKILMPHPQEGEAFFAASNGSISMIGSHHAWIGSGGSTSRIYNTTDGGKSWQLQQLPMEAFSEAAGVYALKFANTKLGVAVGGAYDQPNHTAYAAFYTRNGGRQWLVSSKPPAGYRSGVTLVPDTHTFLAVGTNGTDISLDGGKTWAAVNEHNLNSIQMAPSGKLGWAVGSKGKIFLLKTNNLK